MPIFNYYAKKITGEETKGTRDAQDRRDLSQSLKQDGYILISCEEKKDGRKFSLSFLSISRVSVADKMMFSRNLGVMIAAGLSIVKALEILSHQTKNNKFKKIIIALKDSVQKGNPLSEAMKNYPEVFSSLFTAMVRVGEESGQLSQSLKLVGEQLERDHTLTKRIKGALIYPSIIVIAMLLVGVFMLIYVVPTLVSTFKELNMDLPISTRIVIFVSDLLVSHTIIVFAVLLLAAFFAVGFFRTERGKRIVSSILLRLPVFSTIVKKINSARTSRTLASLVSAGVNVLEALSITKDVLQNYRYKKVLEEARNIVQKGQPISEAFKKADNLYPILVGEMMSVGEETGKLSEMLIRLADFFEEEVNTATKDMTTVIEPVLMIFVGLVVGFFAVSMINPMYSMMGAI
jgi:type IV pilus assembly protein PilC